jgi:hypothetical protein
MEKLLSRFPREPYTGQTTMEDMALVQQSPGLPRSLFDTSEQCPKLCWIESCFEVSSSTKRAFMKHQHVGVARCQGCCERLWIALFATVIKGVLDLIYASHTFPFLSPMQAATRPYLRTCPPRYNEIAKRWRCSTR